MVHYHSSFQPMKILFSPYFVFFSYVFATIWFEYKPFEYEILQTNLYNGPKSFFLSLAVLFLEQPTKPWQQQQNKWIILDVRSVYFGKHQHVGASECCQISCLSPFQQRWFRITSFATQIKGKNFVQAASTVGSVGNYSSGVGHCKWHPFFSVPYLIRSCDCSLHIQDQKMSLINLEEQDSDSKHPMVQIR